MPTASAVVQVAQGLLRGNCSLPSSGVCFFGGVPFAAPPTGNLRWRAPRPPLPWEGERAATSLGPICPQAGAVGVQDESCLFLNVWSPPSCMNIAANGRGSATNGGCAVLLWIHGGGYVIGSGGDYDLASDASLAGDVIFVTTNYRLGALGGLLRDHNNTHMYIRCIYMTCTHSGLHLRFRG